MKEEIQWSKITDADIGKRHWGQRKEPLPFNIIVNDMREIMKHKDAQHCWDTNYGTQSSLSGEGYRVSM